MIVLNKNRIILFMFLAVLGVGIAVFQPTFDEGIAFVSSGITEERSVVVDAGHGAPDYGTSTKEGVMESTINLQIAKKLKEVLENKGYKVIMTRTDENGIYDSTATSIREKKNSDLKNRVKIANNSNADIFISIHLNYIDDNSCWGWQSFYKKSNESSKVLAKVIQQGINDKMDKENTRVPLSIANKYIMDNNKLPSAILECGFMSNKEEIQLLQTDEYQYKLVEGIARGVELYFE